MKNQKAQIYLALVKKDLKYFLQHAFRQSAYPGEAFLDNWHVDAIVHSLNMALAGKRPRQIINLPPRALKSFMVSVAFAAYSIGHDPTAKIMCISYSDELTKVFSRDFRRIVESDWYRQLFPKVRWTKLTETEAVTDRGGGRYAVSIGGSLTGRGADIILIDDPIKATDATSEKSREWVSDWFKNTLSSRLNDKKHGIIILVMQRVHVGDLTGELDGAGYYKLAFPSIAECDEDIPIGPNTVYHRKEGEALHAAREDLETLAGLRKDMGDPLFYAQYQQRPQLPSGNLFKRIYMKALQTMPMLHPSGRFWISIDAAASTSPYADYSALTLGYAVPGADGPNIYILSAKRGRWDFEELVAEAEGAYRRVTKNEGAKVQFIIENASAGISLILHLRKRGYDVFTQDSKQDKVTRACRVIPTFAADRVKFIKIPGKDDWLPPLLAELLTFPNCRFDDQVDSLVYGLIYSEQKVFKGYYDEG